MPLHYVSDLEYIVIALSSHHPSIERIFQLLKIVVILSIIHRRRHFSTKRSPVHCNRKGTSQVFFATSGFHSRDYYVLPVDMFHNYLRLRI